MVSGLCGESRRNAGVVVRSGVGGDQERGSKGGWRWVVEAPRVTCNGAACEWRTCGFESILPRGEAGERRCE